MADNSIRTPGVGENIRTIDRSSVKSGVSVLDVGGTNGERFAGATQKETDWGLWVDQRPSVVSIPITPTVSTTPAYTAKDCVGSYMSFTSAVRASGGSGLLRRVLLGDLGAQNADLDLLFFNQSISGTTTATDNSVFDLADGDIGKFIGMVPIATGFYSVLNDNSVADIPCGLEFTLSGTTTLTGLLIARSTPTYASTTDLVVTLEIERL